MIEEFTAYLVAKNLSNETIQKYLYYYRHLEKDMKDEEELTEEKINKFLIKNRGSPARAFIKNFLEFNNITELKIPKITGRRKRKKRRYLSPKNIKKIGEWLIKNKGLRYYVLLKISYYCALRRSEVLNVKIADIEIDTWNSDKSKGCRLKIHGKGNKERIVIIPAKFMPVLTKYISDQMLKKKIIHPEDLLFPFKKTLWQTAFHDAVKRTLDYNYTIHDLRRSRATFWWKQGKDITQIKTRLGHEEITSTELYINPDEEKEIEKWENE